MGNKLYVVGIGPGSREYILPAAENLIKDSDVLIGGKRNLELFEGLNREKLVIGNNLEDVCTYIRNNAGSKKIAILATGDPGIYSITEFLKARLEDIELDVIPGISSLQYLCCKLKLTWNDMHITSLHGREQEDFINMVKNNAKVAVFTGGSCSPAEVCRRLMDGNVKKLKVAVGENLSYPDERVVAGSPEEIMQLCFKSLSIMIIENDGCIKRPAGAWRFTTPGIPDTLFIRGDVPMTKEEVRAVSISKLRLEETSVVYDIGAGTGSVAVECALRCPDGMVYAVEKNSEAVELIIKNSEKFETRNLEIIHGEAPEAVKMLPKPDRVFIGGSGGSMEDILSLIRQSPGKVRVVINTVTVESTYEAIKGLEDKGFDNIEVISISVSRSRPVGGKHLMQAINPVYIISADKAWDN